MPVTIPIKYPPKRHRARAAYAFGFVNIMNAVAPRDAMMAVSSLIFRNNSMTKTENAARLH